MHKSQEIIIKTLYFVKSFFNNIQYADILKKLQIFNKYFKAILIFTISTNLHKVLQNTLKYSIIMKKKMVQARNYKEFAKNTKQLKNNDKKRNKKQMSKQGLKCYTNVMLARKLTFFFYP